MTALIQQVATTPETARRSEFVRRRGWDLAAHLAAFALLWIFYQAVRGATAAEMPSAMQHAGAVLRFQSSLGMPSEQALQQRVLGLTSVVKLSNVYYVAAHFPVTVVFLLCGWWRHRQRFSRVRNTLVGVTAAGLAMHFAFPLAPPRLLDGFVDTASAIGPSPYDLRISAGANQIAAMPSMHVGWALLVALGVVWLSESRWRFAALAHPLCTAAVVIVTANHYWTDALVATALVVIG